MKEPIVTRTSAAQAGAAVALVLSALVYAISETVTARAWSTPAYSYSANWGFVAQGLLLACAVLLLGGVVRGRTRAAVLGIGAATVVGFVLTGATHSSPDAVAQGTLWLHYTGATMAILGGNALAIVLSRHWRRLRIPRVIGVVGVVLGAAGIVAALTWLATFGVVPPGIPERAAVYAFVLWQLLIGGFVLHVTQPFRALLPSRSHDNS